MELYTLYYNTSNIFLISISHSTDLNRQFFFKIMIYLYRIYLDSLKLRPEA